MNRDQLEHVIRAAATIADDDEIVVVGSQAVLGGIDVSRDLRLRRARRGALDFASAAARRSRRFPVPDATMWHSCNTPPARLDRLRESF